MKAYRGMPNASKSKKLVVVVPPLVRLPTTCRFDSVVDSPRRICRENTKPAVQSDLERTLVDFYDKAVYVDTTQVDEIKRRTQLLVDLLRPKIKRLCSQACMKLLDILEYGSTVDKLITSDCRCLDMCLVFDRSGLKLDTTRSGYISIPLYKNRQGRGSKRDRWHFGRCGDDGGVSLCPGATLATLDEIITRAVKTLPPELRKTTRLVSERGVISLQLGEHVTLELSAGFKNELDESYFVSRIFDGDDAAVGTKCWRIIRPNQEHSILAGTSLADRCNSIMAIQCMKALVKLEPTINGISSYQIKTAQLIASDEGIDTNYRWQRAGLEVCFVNLLSRLSSAYNSGRMNNFYDKDDNLLRYVDVKLQRKLSTRLQFLVCNHKEIIRILRKRWCEHIPALDHIGEFLRADAEAIASLQGDQEQDDEYEDDVAECGHE